MTPKKTHIAGEVDGAGVQRCVRCHSQINSDWVTQITNWPTGASITSDGRGNMRVVGAENTVRQCGKQAEVSR